jgi:hypothetical protein
MSCTHVDGTLELHVEKITRSNCILNFEVGVYMSLVQNKRDRIIDSTVDNQRSSAQHKVLSPTVNSETDKRQVHYIT